MPLPQMDAAEGLQPHARSPLLDRSIQVLCVLPILAPKVMKEESCARIIIASRVKELKAPMAAESSH